MRFLKIILWTILSACILWGSCILLGPSLINRLINAAYGERVVIQRLDVSPNLVVSAALVEIDLRSENRTIGDKVIVRGPILSWDLHDGLLIRLKTGPIRVGNTANLQSLNATFSPNRLFSLSEVDAKVAVTALGTDYISAETFELKSKIVGEFTKLENISLNAFGVTYKLADDALNVPVVTARLSPVTLEKPMETQYLDTEFIAPSGIEHSEVRIGTAELQAVLNSGLVDMELHLGDLAFPQLDIAANSAKVNSQFDVRDAAFGPTWHFNAENISANTFEFTSSKYQGSVTIQDGDISHIGTGKIDSLPLKMAGNYLGEIENSDLSVQVTARKLTQKSSEVSVSANIQANIGLQMSISAESELLSPSALRCMDEICKMRNGKAAYLISTPNSELVGMSECGDEACGLGSAKHRLETKNTDVFFEELTGAKILSPLMLPLFYMGMKRGVPQDQGHVLEF